MAFNDKAYVCKRLHVREIPCACERSRIACQENSFSPH